MADFKGKKVAVLGFGVEGLSSTRFFIQQGALVTVLDKKSQTELDKISISEAKSLGATFVFGSAYLLGLDQFQVLVKSPGIKRNLKELREAEKKGAVITSQTQLFFDLCPCPIIGVTGTKGKGTTASLIYEMLKAQNLDAYLGGNIGTPPLDFLDKLKKDSWVVLELSSFQLLDLGSSHLGGDEVDASPPSEVNFGKPHIAVMLMVVPEHLNYHTDVNEYVNAKRNILRFQTASDFAILNRDYPAVSESDTHAEGKVFYVSREREVEEGSFVKNGKILVKIGAEVAYKNFLGPAIRLSSSENFESSPHPVKEIEIIDTKDILLPGKHNLENVCAAVMAATLAGASKENIVKVLKTFKGLEHRLELVGEVNGAKYYDDSFSTTPETAIAAIQAFKQPEILILGGSSKGSDFTELGKIISESKNIKAIIGIGEEWQRIKAQFSIKPQKLNIKNLNNKNSLKISNFKFQIYEELKDMREIVKKASEIARSGDVVLLSPACASFGMFKNYKDRGEQFKREVKHIRNIKT